VTGGTSDSGGISAFILAGGKSSRFGSDKALFEYRGRPLIEHVIESIRPVVGRMAIISNEPERLAYLEIPCHPDSVEGLGPFGGVYTAMLLCVTDFALVVGCDMPEISADLIRYMASVSGGYDVVVPRVGGWYEPLHALYSKRCLPPAEKSIRAGNRQIVSFFTEVSVRAVEEEEVSRFGDPARLFRNINYRREAGDE
jgi:molybdopterin-guanine dinucleotide biosynthesis protein A